MALRLLHDPSITKNVALQKFFTNLKPNYKIPTRIPCVVFKNKDDAKHWIMLEHTGQNEGVGIVPWKPVQKERFRNKSLHLPQIMEYIGDTLDTSNIKQSNLKRLISTPDVRKKIGLSFLGETIREEKPKAVILKNLKLVLFEMSKEGFTVREIYYAEDRKKWIDQILNAAHRTTSSATPTTRSQSSHDRPRSSDRKYLIPKNCKLPINEPRINDIFLELRDALVLNGRKTTPNAVAVLFRVFLETSLDKYILVARLDLHKRPKIKEKINSVTKHMTKIKIASNYQLLRVRAISADAYTDILNIQWFHQYVHSSTMLPESDALKAKWDNLQEFFEILWEFINKTSR